MGAFGEAPAFLKRYEEILNEKIMTARAKQPCRMPRVENLHLLEGGRS